MELNISELKKSLQTLSKNFKEDSKSLSQTFDDTSKALSSRFYELNSLHLSINTDGLQTSLNALQENFNNTSEVIEENVEAMNESLDNSKNMLDEAKGANKSLEKANSNIKDILGQLTSVSNNIGNTLSFGGGTDGVGQGLSRDSVDKIINAFFPDSASKISPWVDLAGFIYRFDTGGIVPGSFSQPVPVMAHGSEMVLNPGQQANLFNMLNGKGQAQTQSSPNYLYAPQIKTGVSAQDVFNVLNQHNRRFFSMISEGVQKDSNLRNAVRST